MSSPRRRLTSSCIGGIAACLFVSGAACSEPLPTSAPSAKPSESSAKPSAPFAKPSESPEPATRPVTGAYLGYDADSVARMAEFRQWLGGADPRVGHTYLPGDRWSNIEGGPSFLDAWARWRRERPDRLLVLNVPMLERSEDGLSDQEVRSLLGQGALGAFDRHFRALAERLVRLGVPDTVIVLGWEMNGATYTHRCGPDPQAWKAYWTRVVANMRNVPGQMFRFDFAPSLGPDAVPWTMCYPGDDSVDIIGMDAYDQPAGVTFDEQVAMPYGLREQVAFAKAHGKPISYPEWGLFRNGDNPEYMRGMLAWIDEHRPVYNTIMDYCPHGVWRCGANPKSSQVFREWLSGRVGQTPATGAVPPAAPAAAAAH